MLQYTEMQSDAVKTIKTKVSFSIAILSGEWSQKRLPVEYVNTLNEEMKTLCTLQ